MIPGALTRQEADAILLRFIRDSGGHLLWPCPTPGCSFSRNTRGHVCDTIGADR